MSPVSTVDREAQSTEADHGSDRRPDVDVLDGQQAVGDPVNGRRHHHDEQQRPEA